MRATPQILRPLKKRVDPIVRSVNKRLPRRQIPAVAVPVVACCVYRAQNRQHVAQMIRKLPQGCDIRLHALDRPASDLATLTISDGPGLRMPLLQALLDARPLAEGSWVLVFDDDMDFALPGRSAFMDIATAAGFDIAGAAIDVDQHRTYRHSLVGRASVARTTGMVEVGPLVAFSPVAQQHILPFPSDSGMGWGLDIRWAHVAGLRKGYVDATPILHFSPVGVAYDKTLEWQRVKRELRAAGMASQHDRDMTLETWRPWEHRPVWLRVDE